MTTPFVGDYDWPTILAQAERSVQTRAAAVMVTGTTIFTIVGGPIIIRELMSECVTANDTTASTLQWSADGDVGAATALTAASASLASAIAGTFAFCLWTSLATAPALYTAGVGITRTADTGSTGGAVVPAGIITTTIAVGSTTGTWRHYMRFTPLGRDVRVTPAF